MPNEKSLKAYYDNESYFQGDTKGSYTDYDFNTEAVIPLFHDFLLTIPNATGKKILDIGCAFGTHLAMAAKQGWEAWGVELSDYARKIALSRHGEEIHVVEVIDNLPKLEFDLIVMLDVLEHLPNPYELFIELFLHGVIGKKTQLVITTPNARSADALANPANWAYRHPPAHLVYFSANSLRLLFTNLGGIEISIQGIYPIEHRESCDYPDENNNLNQDLKNYAGLMAVVQGFDPSLQKFLSFLENELISIKKPEITLLFRDFFSLQKAVIQRYTFEEVSLKAKLTHQAQEIRQLFSELTDTQHEVAQHAEETNHLRSLLAQRDQSIETLNNSLRHKEEVLTNVKDEFLRAEAELQTIRRTKWFRLRDAIIHQPWGFRKVARVAYLSGAMAIPPLIRERLSPWMFRIRARFDAPWTALTPNSDGNGAYPVRQQAFTTPNRPHVMHIIANFMTGGSSRLVVDLIENLSAHYEQSVVTSFIPTPPAYIGVNITEFRFPKNEQLFIDHFSQLKPDLLHVHYWGDCDEPWYAKTIVAAEHLNIPIIENINTPVAPYISSAVQRYVYVSDYVRHVFGQNHPAHVTVYPGSDFSHFDRKSDELMADDCIGMVYRLEHDKLNEGAIVPFIRAVQKRPQTRVLIVGGGSLLEPFRHAVAEAGLDNNFEFTGYVSYDALPDLYRRMSVFVAPVWKESFGQVSAFAMNMRIPVIGYDIGAIGEIIDNSQLVVPAADADRLADIAINLLDSPELRERIGQQQATRAQELFSIQAMNKSYAELYAEIGRTQKTPSL